MCVHRVPEEREYVLCVCTVYLRREKDIGGHIPHSSYTKLDVNASPADFH